MEDKKNSLRREDLGQGKGVWVTKDSAITTDTLLLARFAAPRPRDRCADLGTGCGAIPILWRLEGAMGPICGVEIQEELAALAARSVKENGFDREITVLWGDAAKPKDLLPHQGLDLIACNPPYYSAGTGKTGSGSRAIARHEETLTLESLAQTARYTLTYGGRLCVCLPAERLAEAIRIFAAQGLEPKRLQLVQSKAEKPPYLALLECYRGGKTGLVIEKNLVLESDPPHYGRG